MATLIVCPNGHECDAVRGRRCPVCGAPLALSPPEPASVPPVVRLPEQEPPHLMPSLEAIGRTTGATAPLAEDFRRFRAAEPMPMSPGALPERAPPWAPRRRAIAILLGLVVAGGVACLIFAAVGNGQVRHQRDLARRERETAERAKDEADQLRAGAEDRERAASRHLYFAHVNLAQAAWREGRLGHTLELLRSGLSEEGRDDFRGFEWHYLWRLCHSEALRLTHDYVGAHVLWNRDGRYVAAFGDAGGASQGSAATVWDARSGQALATFREPDTRILSAAFLPDGSGLVLVLTDPVRADVPAGEAVCTVLVRQLPSGKSIPRFQTPTVRASRSALSADGSVLAMQTASGLRVWNTVTGQEAQLPPSARMPFRETTALALSPDGRRLAVAGSDAVGEQQPRDVVAVDLNTGAEGVVRYLLKPRTTDGDREPVQRLAYSPDGKLLALGGSRGTLCVGETGRATVLFSRPSGGTAVVDLAFNPDGNTLAAACPSTGVRLWDLGRGFHRTTLPGHAGALTAVAYSANGKRLATVGMDGLLKVWELRLDPETATLPEPVEALTNLGFSPDGRYLAASGKTPGRAQPRITLQDVATGETVQTFSDEGLVSFTTDGRTLRVWNHNQQNRLQLWDVKTGQPLSARTLPGKLVSSAPTALSSDGRWLAYSNGRDGEHNSVQWADARDDGGAPFVKPSSAAFETTALRFSPDGRRLVAAAFDAQKKRSVFQMWDTETGAELEAPPETAGQVVRLFFHPDNNHLAMIVNTSRRAENEVTCEVRLWDLAAGRLVLTVPQTNRTVAVAFSPDGQRMAVGCGDRQVRLYETLGGQELLALPVKQGDLIQHLAYSPDGCRLAGVCGRTGDAVFYVHLWDATPPAVPQTKPNESGS